MTISTPNLLTSGSSSSTSKSQTTASISPTGNSLIVVTCTARTTAGAQNIAVSDSFSGGLGSWTEIDILNTGANQLGMVVAYAIAASSPGSGTITFTVTNNAIRWVWSVYEIATGYNTSTPIKQSKTGEGTTSTPFTYSLTLDSTPDSDSLVFGAICDRGDTDEVIDPGSAYTELLDHSSGSGSGHIYHEDEYDLTPTSTTVDWGSVNGETVAVAIEVDAAGAGGRTTRNTDPRPLGVFSGVSRTINTTGAI